MKLSDLLKPECVKIGLKASSKEGILKELANFMAEVYPSIEAKDAEEALLNREKKGSTGLSRGLAVPHGRSSFVKEMFLVVVYDPDGKDFDSGDGKASHFFFTVLAADSYSPHAQLEILRMIAEIYERTNLLKDIESVKDESELYDLLISKEAEIL